MEITIRRGTNSDGSRFCNWSIGNYHRRHTTWEGTEYDSNKWIFYSDDDYSALVGHSIELIPKGNITMVCFNGHRKLFDFPIHIRIGNISLEKAKNELIKRRKLILEWIESLPREDFIKFSV